MPQLSDILQKRKEKAFVKKSYRPWDLSGNNNFQDYSSSEPTNEKINTHQDNNHDKNIITSLNQIKGNELDNDQVTIREQLENNKITIREQLGNDQVTIREQSGNSQVTVREQLDNELGALSNKNRYIKLSGVQRKILDFIFEICLLRDSLETGPIETDIIAKHIDTSYGVIKTSLIRLIKKNFLVRLPGKTAKGGFINLMLPQTINQIIKEIKLDDSFTKNMPELFKSFKEKLDNNKGNEKPIISSNNIITTTRKLSPEWENINLEPLKHIGFTKTQLFQLYDKHLNTPEIIQESIDHFAYGLENNKKVKEYPNPLNVLMGVLRKGQCWSEPNYESPQEIALQTLIQHTQKRKEKQDTLIEQLLNVEFPGWEQSLTPNQLTEILPVELLNSRLSGGRKALLQKHFKESILIPKLKQEGII